VTLPLYVIIAIGVATVLGLNLGLTLLLDKREERALKGHYKRLRGEAERKRTSP
jgi:hypothetical protein